MLSSLSPFYLFWCTFLAVDLLEDLVVAEAIRTMIGKTLFTPFKLQTSSLYSFNCRLKIFYPQKKGEQFLMY